MTTTTADVEDYATEVRAALSDLPPADRDDLLADLEDHLAEVAAEGRLGELGDPGAYAAELRSSAGLPPRRPTRRSDRLRTFADGPWARGTLAFLPRLVPGWWVLRGLLFPAALMWWRTPLPMMALLAVLTVPASVLLGLHARDDLLTRLLDLAATATALAAALLTVVVWSDILNDASQPRVDSGYPSLLDGVTNLYPYSRDGRPLTGVQLFDQYGRPVVLTGEVDAQGHTVRRTPARTRDGRDVGNVYPQQQEIQDDPIMSPDNPFRPVTPPGVRAPRLSGD